MLAGDHGLRVVERWIACADLFDRLARKRGQRGEAAERVRVARLRRMEQGLGLLLQLLEIWAVRQLARHRTTSMLGLWFASRQHGGVGAVGPEERMTVGLALRANPRAPFVRARSRYPQRRRVSICVVQKAAEI